MGELQFTVDWTTGHTVHWDQALSGLKAETVVEFLEIGAFEGRTTRWMLEHFPNAVVTVVDPFTGGADQKDLQLEGLWDRFMNNTKEFFDAGRMRIIKRESYKALPTLFAADYVGTFDFIYVDGSHLANDVLFDACAAFHLLRPGGLMCFDDYGWGIDPNPVHQPKMAIDAFLACFSEQIEVLSKEYQVWVRKK